MTHELLEAVKFARTHQLNQKHALEEMHKTAHEKFMKELNMNIAYLVSSIKTTLEAEQGYATAALQKFKDSSASWSLKTNKMSEFVIPESRKFYDGENAGRLITNPKLTHDISIGETLPLLRNDDAWKAGEYNTEFWGTSKPTYLAAELTFAYLSLENHLHPETSSSISSFSLESPFHHVIPYDTSILPHQESKLIYNVAGKPTGYGVIHGGYSFGGPRGQESLYPEAKSFAPHDCSSIVKEWTLPKATANWAKIGMSTFDLTYAYVNDATIPKEWYDSPDGLLPSQYTPVAVENAAQGDLYVIRRNCSEAKPFGTGGHTGIVSNVRGADFRADQVEILSTNRDMPHMEGIGCQYMSRVNTTNPDGSQNKVMYLRPNYATPLHEDFSMENVIRSTDQYMLDNPDEYLSVFGACSAPGASEE